jgi:hypothetical protein
LPSVEKAALEKYARGTNPSAADQFYSLAK